MSHYLVTGGAGFVGSHLVASLLEDGHRVRVLDDLSTGRRERVPNGAELQAGSVTDGKAVRVAAQDCEGVFHLAAIASVERCRLDWLGSHQVNQTGLIRVLEVARAIDGRPAIPVIYTSSAAVYGENQAMPLDEDSATKPISPYGADKLAGEVQASAAFHTFGVPSIGFRPFNVYGAGQDPASPYSGVISIFAAALQAGQEVVIYGDGKQTRDFVAVADVVQALKAGMKSKPVGAEIMVVCRGREVSLLELVTTLGHILGVAPRIDFKPPRVGDIRRSLGSSKRLAARLGFSPSTDLDAGLRAMLAST